MSAKKAIGESVAAAADAANDFDVGEVVNQSQGAEDGQYQRTISSRQIHVMSLGGQIGAGIFISSGKNLRDGGPASLLLAFATVCTCVWAMLQSVSEMTIAFPVSGNYIDFADRFVDPALGFAGGFSKWLGWTAIVASEATFFSVLVNYWAQESVHEAVWFSLFLICIFVIFALPNSAFAWFEYATAVLKIFALIIFIIVAFALVLGAGPDGYFHHGATWQGGLAFQNGFKGYGNSVLLAILAIGDNSFTGFIAGEAVSPRYSVAHAVNLIPARVTGFYLVSMMFIGLLVPPDSDRLLGGSGVAASPFVISIDEAGIKGLPDLLNVVIIFAVMSIGAESVYVASRILRAMSHQRLIPHWIARVDRRGRPRTALAITLGVAIALTYCNLSAGGIEVYKYRATGLNWLAQISTTGYFCVWIVVGITSLRFRAALKAQNDPLFQESYAWKCAIWPFPPIWLLVCCTLYTGCSLYLALYPIGADAPSAYSFFQYMIGLLLIISTGFGYKILFRTKLRDPATVDLKTGRRPLGVEEIRMLNEYYALPLRHRLWAYLKLW
ncbi:hypothetical protein KC363_g6826 [Hortaea werneckii]|nr:hypothetical protein KC363_g6826 [Hortaea werneckii]KAI7508268.1 hypothetical protein KC347_g6286 [Hortaea werneckii]